MNQKKNDEIRKFFSGDPAVNYLFDEIRSIRCYVNDLHENVGKIDSRLAKIEGLASTFLKLGLPIITGLVISIIMLLFKIAFGA